MKSIREYAEDAGYNTIEYSGRCMLGKTCLAIITGNHLQAVALMAGKAGAAQDFDAVARISRAKMDSIGLETVVYWPNEPAI